MGAPASGSAGDERLVGGGWALGHRGDAWGLGEGAVGFYLVGLRRFCNFVDWEGGGPLGICGLGFAVAGGLKSGWLRLFVD